MKNTIKYGSIFLLILYVFSFVSYAQVDKSSYYNRGKKFYFNYFYEPADYGDSIRVITIYKIAFDLLKFTKIEEPGLDNVYIAYPEFEVNFKDEEGIIRKRDKKKDTIVVNDYKLINRVDVFYYGSVVSKLSFKEYTSYVYLWDEDLVKLGEKKLPKFDLTRFKTSVGVSSPLICYAGNNSDTSSIYPYILDRNAAFSSKDVLFYFLTNNLDHGIDYQASIEFLDAGRTSIDWENGSRISVLAESFYDKAVKFINKSHERPIFKLINGNPQERGYEGIIKIIFTADKTAPGNYKLRLWDNKSDDTLEFDFRIIWENIPFTLRMPKYAADIMYYVLNDDEYDEIKSGSDREILHNIFEWWRKQDPTRFTLYNEAMAEFFRRVDYAFFNFKTIYEKDGAKTDRGKIYILNGPPDDKKRNMHKSGRITEVWIYYNLKKEYIFESDIDNIIYLKEVKDI
jgi:GWxTD domain-containing protein